MNQPSQSFDPLRSTGYRTAAPLQRNATLSARTVGTTSSSSSSKPRSLATVSSIESGGIFVKRNGRQYLRTVISPYPLPCDLAELNRQTVRTLLLMQIFGSPFCSPYFDDAPPRRILEVACGSAVWSSICHSQLGPNTNIDFIGTDIVHQAPDLRKRGLRWRFIQHDLRKPSPFPDGYFDFVFVKDTGLCSLASKLQAEPLADFLRVLKPGGTLEVWDANHLIRSLLPAPPLPRGADEDDIKQAEETGTYLVSPATPFTTAQNKYIQQYNEWLQSALDKRGLTAVPCAFITMAFSTETDAFSDFGSRRIAIPFSHVLWEKTPGSQRKRSIIELTDMPQPAEQLKSLNPEQLSFRRMALETLVDMVGGLEPILMESSGKTADEWERWWSSMKSDLLTSNGTEHGECLEVGAWWGQKK